MRLDIHCNGGNLSDDDSSVSSFLDSVNNISPSENEYIAVLLSKHAQVVGLARIKSNFPVVWCALQFKSARSWGTISEKEAASASRANRPSIVLLK